MVPALKPETAPIDGRGMDDLILFLEKYGELLNYYDATNSIQGNWRPFMAKDISTILASIAVYDYKDCLQTYYKYFDKIQRKEGPLDQHFKVLFDISFTLLDDVRHWNERLVQKTSAKEMMFREIDTGLAFYLRDLILYYRAAQNAYQPAHNDFVDTSFVLPAGSELFVPSDSEQILLNTFKQEWWKKYLSADVINNWDHYKDVYLAPKIVAVSIFGDLSWSDDDNIQYASSFVRNLFTNIYNAYVRIITTVRKYFDDSVRNYAGHSAHNGLVISFLHLFGEAQQELNRFTDRHLNFYYKDVLRIQRRPPNPDAAHLVFTLAKNAPVFTLGKGIALLGKDKRGKELVYKTSNTLTVTKSEIAALKSIFVDDDAALGGAFSAEIANSSDGNGKELNPEDPSWFAFGKPQSALSEEQRTMTEADAGFLIGSPILILSEGERVVTVQINVSSFGPESFTTGELASKLDLFITGKKGWIQLPDIGSSNTSLPNAIRVESNRIVIKFTLEAGIDPIVPLDAKLHQATYSTSSPVLKCLLKKTNDVALYKKLMAVSVSTIDITATVNNAVICLLHSDQGSIDNKNPFMPFGPRPKKDSAFYFGSHEVFSKRVTSLTLKLKWLGTPAGVTFYDHYVYKKGSTDTNYIDILSTGTTSAFTVSGKVKDGEEITKNPTSTTLFDSGNDYTIDTNKDFVFSNLFTGSAPDLEPFTTFDPSLRRGFLKLTLATPAKAFGHHVFSKVYTEQVIAVNDNSSTNSLPNEPYTPLLQPLTYNYTAQESIMVGEGNDPSKGQFFHVFPFGYAEQKQGTGAALVFPFTDTDAESVTYSLQGALHIGIKNSKANQLLTVYIEFSEGSEDASVDPPGVLWSYLSDNQWRCLDEFILADSTNGFLGSGIVMIKVPENMNEDNTIMPSGLRWLRVGVPESYQAYPKVYAVFTNAVKAVYDTGNDNQEHLAEPLPAGSITKLQVSQAAIKKISQPYDSFDGRTLEKDNKYYTRVSERLRHKNRAITIWDYERIILEEFTYLYKVKCLNHTNDETETAPGCVRIITIPDMTSKSTGNLFMPMISNNKRKTIKDHVTKLNCPFADVQVQNPQYEAINVKCEVKIKEGLDEEEHIKKLREDIDKFLAPWAFEEGRGIDFGGKMHRSQIIYYMEKLEYVDYVTDFLMDLYIDGSVQTNLEEVKASTSRSVLTSYRNHVIGTNVCAS
jgi:hypothetical protein